jgi:hypothetical protein
MPGRLITIALITFILIMATIEGAYVGSNFYTVTSTTKSPSPTPTSSSNSYSTSFPTVENPISDNGSFITSTTPGVNWSGLRLGDCGCKAVSPIAITAPGLAQSPNIANSNAGDALAVLTGIWAPDQTASVVVADILPSPNNGYEEIEIHLRTDSATGRGYEITWGYNNSYIIIATWNGGGVTGARAAYSMLLNSSGPQYAILSGDILKAIIKGNMITMYRNGVQLVQYTDYNNSFSTGNPGFGFNEGAAGNYGISSFSARSF